MVYVWKYLDGWKWFFEKLTDVIHAETSMKVCWVFPLEACPLCLFIFYCELRILCYALLFFLYTLNANFLLFPYQYLTPNSFVNEILKFQWGFPKTKTILLSFLSSFNSVTEVIVRVAHNGGSWGGGDTRINQQFSFMNKKIGRFLISIWGI